MENETIQTLLVDQDLDSYKSFFDGEWCDLIVECVKNSRLKCAVDALMVAWRLTAGAHFLPWLMVEQLKDFAQGNYKGHLEFRAAWNERVIEGLCDSLEAWTPSLSTEQRREQRRTVVQIEKQAFQAVKKAQSEIQSLVKQYWESMIDLPMFCFSILGLQRTNYAALFFAYEDFLASAIKATKGASYSSKGRNVGQDFAARFQRSVRRL